LINEGKGFDDVSGMTQLKELVMEGFINVLKPKNIQKKTILEC
jgi:hypothetical protein